METQVKGKQLTKDKDQSARFIEAAKKAEADLCSKEFERAFKKIVKAEKPGKKPA
jgi:hypothetical protein